MIVMKFGGTSVGDAKRIISTASIIKSFAKKNPLVVVSAMAKITDALIKLAHESAKGEGGAILEFVKETHEKILRDLGLDSKILDSDIQQLSELANKTNKTKNFKYGGIDTKTLDCFQSFGELMSSKIIAAQLNKIGVKSKAFNSWEIGLLTDSAYGNAEPLEASYHKIKNSLKGLKLVPVVTGFIGKTEKGDITTLGRGGSDYTAAIIGNAVDAEEIQIWTDVNGIMSADPKIVKSVKIIETISFAEASELAYFGAKVLHPKTILPAIKKNIPVKVLNSFSPSNRGTLIIKQAKKTQQTVKSIACKKNITLINVESTRMLGAYGFLARLFEVFGKHKKSVDVVSTSEVSVSLTIDNDKDIEKILDELKGIANVKIIKDKAIVCVVGEGMRKIPGIAGRTFSALGKNNINIEVISQGASEINITFIVDGKDAEKAVKALHREYFGG